MKVYFRAILLLPFIMVVNFSKAQSNYERALDFQIELDSSFANLEESPLTEEDFKTFSGLEFFEIDTLFSIEALLTLTPEDSVFEMATTTERRPKYRRYGIASFVIEKDTFSLNIYENIRLKTIPKYEDHLFLPFLDKTNGFESYGGGRYIDLKKPETGDVIVIDFNQCFNPYCAYNGKYSCPIVPIENSLEIEIRAGVKAPKSHH